MRYIAQTMIVFIRGYQLLLSPYLGRHCRFSPSCSQFAIEAFQKHSVLKALQLSIKRILRCHPWHPGGYDPVP